MLSPEEIERLAGVMAVPTAHRRELTGRYHCQWPEQGTPSPVNAFCYARGCKGCLMGVMAQYLNDGAQFIAFGDGTEYRGEDAVAIVQRAIELAPAAQELMARQTSNQWAELVQL